MRLDPLPSRIKGRLSLERRIRALALASYRYSVGRARTPDDLRFGHQVYDALTGLLQRIEADHQGGEARASDSADRVALAASEKVLYGLGKGETPCR